MYLERAGYKDVIERDGSAINKIRLVMISDLDGNPISKQSLFLFRLCVSQDIEMKKCETMKRAAYSRDIRPEIECVLKDDCLKTVKQSNADVTVVKGNAYKDAKDQQLEPLLYETLTDINVYVVVVDPSLSKDVLKKSPV